MANEALYLFYIVGASHLNDSVAFFGVCFYVALCQHEAEEFATINAEDAFFRVEAKVVLS